MKISELTTKVNSYEVTDPTKQVSADEYNTILQTVQEHDATLPVTVAKVEELENKAITTENIEDSIKDLSVKDLTGVIEATPEEFNFRPSAGDKSIRDESAVIRSIKGNSLVWNQTVKLRKSGELNGLTLTNENNILRISGTLTTALAYDIVKITEYSDIPLKKDGRKYLISLNAPNGVAYGINGHPIVNAKPHFWSYTEDAVFYGYISIKIPVGTTVDYTFSNPQIIDLTQMFGSGNEPSTIEEFYARIPYNIDLYAYNEGEIINNNVGCIKTVGFNQWDEEWELSSTKEYIVSKNFCKAIPNTDYYVFMGDSDGQVNLNWYDSSYKVIRTDYSLKTRKFKSPERASFFKLRFFTDYGTTYKHDVCINLSHSGVRNGEYEPYKENYRALPDIKKYFPDGMKSAGSVYDEINSQSAIQRVGAVDLGSLKWVKNEAYGYYCSKTNLPSDIMMNRTDNDIPSIQCERYAIGTAVEILHHNSKGLISLSPTHLLVSDLSYDNAEALKAALQGVMLYYELAEPIETPLGEPIQLDYVVEDWGTEEAISDEPSTPFKADIVYQFNAEGRIRDNSRNIEILENTVRLLQAKIQEIEALLTTEVENIDESETIIE